MQLTVSLRKAVYGLDSAKNRRESGLFIAEGTKCVLETIGSFSLRYLFATERWIREHQDQVRIPSGKLCQVTEADIDRMSHLKTPQPVIAVYEIPEMEFDCNDLRNELVLALDRISDPGNLGTIIRLANWFGIKTILASADTVDCFSPKVVQATMGAIGRVKVIYLPLPETLSKLSAGKEIYGTFLDGDNIYDTPLSPSGVIVMGNEGAGISSVVEANVSKRLLIPSFPEGVPVVESLNVATATAIVLSEFRRRELKK